jgi:Xaa-Pro aminopeptidase
MGTREPPFDSSEYERRHRAVQSELAARDVDVLVVTDPANVNYLTGYDGWSFYVPQAVLVVAGRDEPVWVGRPMDVPEARAETYLDEDSVVAYDEGSVQAGGNAHPFDFVAALVEDFAPDRVGVARDAYYYSAVTDERLRRGLSDATLVDASLLVERVRTEKSDAELRYVSEAARLSDAAVERVRERLAPGVRESRLAGDVFGLLVGGVEEFGGDVPAIPPLMPAGPTTGGPHFRWSDRPFERGDALVVELSGCRHRYHAPVSRTFYVGEVPEAAREVAAVVDEGLSAVVDAIRPGVTAASVASVWEDAVAGTPVEKSSRIGYACGLGYPPDWGEHTVSVRPGDETVLAEGMTIHLIPGLWREDAPVVLSETVRVTADGAERLSDLDRELFAV